MSRNGSKAVLWAVGVIGTFYYMPIVGVLLVLIFINWKFREFIWRLNMAWLIFLLVFFVGLYLSHGVDGFVGWLMR